MINNISNFKQVNSQQKSNLSFGTSLYVNTKGVKPSSLTNGEENFFLETLKILFKNGDLDKSKFVSKTNGKNLLISVAGAGDKLIILPKGMPRKNKKLYDTILGFIDGKSQ